jgi:hypothetical protein
MQGRCKLSCGTSGTIILWEGIENLLVSSKLRCGTNGTIFLVGWLSVSHSPILYRLMFGTSGTILLKKRHSVFYSAIFSSVLEPVDCETRVVCGCCHVYFFSLVFYCSSLIFLLITMRCGRCCGGDYHALLALLWPGRFCLDCLGEVVDDYFYGCVSSTRCHSSFLENPLVHASNAVIDSLSFGVRFAVRSKARVL